ncbi:MAG: oligosaccharide flippase family protein [Burkholderiales bacterium]|nr:oligosaccharide flippase family protein [Burkholderiales bacterium]
MSLSRNLFAGLANSIWSALIALAVVPLYIKYLGIESYGLIGFFVTTQALLQFLDMGLAPTINREVARCSASGSLKEAGSLLHTLALVYWCMAVVIALLIAGLAHLIAGHWLQPKHLSRQTVEHAVMLMGLVVACRWPVGLYQGALIGAQRLTVSSGISILMTTIGSLGAIAVLAFVSPTIQAFFVWQACVGLAYALSIRWAAWRIIERTETIKFDIDRLKRVWRFSAGMGGIGLAALVFTQLDKVILSKMLELEEFAHYMLATVVVSALYVLITPIFNVVYPRFSALVVKEDVEQLTKLYRLGTRLLATVLFPIAMLLAVFAGDFVRIWTGNPALAADVAPIISLLAIGSALHGVTYLPYALQLAYGMTRLPLTIITILMAIFVPLVVYFALTYGALGGAIAWLILHVVYVCLTSWLTHRQLLKGVGGKWLFQDIGVPLILSLLAGLIGHYVIQPSAIPTYVKVAGTGLLAAAAIALSLSASRPLRDALRSAFGRNHGVTA